MKKYIGIALALGDIYEECGEGKLKEPLDGAIARLDAVMNRLPHNVKTTVICTAGYCPEEPRIPQPDRLISLADQLKKFVLRSRFFPHTQIFTKPICWSTRNEIRVAIKVAQRLNVASKDEEVILVIASNLTHLLRIWFYTKMYAPKKWRVVLVRARHHFSLMSHLLELPKALRDIYYADYLRERFWRSKACKAFFKLFPTSR